MKCKRCSKNLTGKQTSYCSKYCSKLHLKSLYKKRKKEHVNAYSRRIRKIGGSPLSSNSKHRKEIMNNEGYCARCNTRLNLHIHHIKPLKNKGTNERKNLIVLCRGCHSLWHKKMKGFWLN